VSRLEGLERLSNFLRPTTTPAAAPPPSSPALPVAEPASSLHQQQQATVPATAEPVQGHLRGSHQGAAPGSNEGNAGPGSNEGNAGPGSNEAHQQPAALVDRKILAAIWSEYTEQDTLLLPTLDRELKMLLRKCEVRVSLANLLLCFVGRCRMGNWAMAFCSTLSHLVSVASCQHDNFAHSPCMYMTHSATNVSRCLRCCSFLIALITLCIC
jgi:hypothetical protein